MITIKRFKRNPEKVGLFWNDDPFQDLSGKAVCELVDALSRYKEILQAKMRAGIRIIRIRISIMVGLEIVMQRIFQEIKNTATTVSIYILPLIICD
jgi:hypothetical protein